MAQLKRGRARALGIGCLLLLPVHSLVARAAEPTPDQKVEWLEASFDRSAQSYSRGWKRTAVPQLVSGVFMSGFGVGLWVYQNANPPPPGVSNFPLFPILSLTMGVGQIVTSFSLFGSSPYELDWREKLKVSEKPDAAGRLAVMEEWLKKRAELERDERTSGVLFGFLDTMLLSIFAISQKDSGSGLSVNLFWLAGVFASNGFIQLFHRTYSEDLLEDYQEWSKGNESVKPHARLKLEPEVFGNLQSGGLGLALRF